MGMPHQTAIDIRNMHLETHGRPIPSASRDATDALLWRVWRRGAYTRVYPQEYARAQRRHEFSTPEAAAEFERTVQGMFPEGAAPAAVARREICDRPAIPVPLKSSITGN